MTYHRWITLLAALPTTGLLGLFWLTDLNPWLGFMSGMGIGTTFLMAMICWRWRI